MRARGTLLTVLGCALVVVATLSAEASAWAATIDREPVRATFVRRFSVPMVGTVLGTEIGGRSYAQAFDWLWWTRAPNGQRWTLLGSQPSPFTPWLVAPDPARPDTVYGADQEGTIFRSEDAGATWERRGSAPSGFTNQILVAATGLLVVGDSGDCSPCRSSDGGRSWETSVSKEYQLVLAPGNRRIVYSFVPGWIHRSSNEGRSFIDVSPAQGEGASALAIAPSDADVVYALAPAYTAAFLRRTDNGGASWTELVPPVPGLAWSGPAVAPATATHLVILGGPQEESAPRQLFESFDGGASWIAHAGSVNATALRVSAARSGLEIEAFGRRGIFTTRDRGDSWVSADVGIAADYDLELARGSNGDLYLVNLESGGVWRSQNGGRAWELRGSLPGIESLYVDPFEPTKLLALDRSEVAVWWSDDSGRTWSQRDGPDPQNTILISSLTFDPHRRDTIYASTLEDAWLSADRGRTWSLWTSSLPPGSECSQHTGVCYELRDVDSIIPDPFVPGRFFVVAHSYDPFQTDDDGATWKFLKSPLLSSNDGPLILPDPRIEDRLYLGGQYTTTVLQSDRAGAPPWRILLRKPDYGQMYSDWLTFDPQGRLVVAPARDSATFLRRLGGSTWERFSVVLPYEEEVRLLEPLVPIPGGGARMFLLVPGLGLFSVDLPSSSKP
jgi:photosystem II stability/assembly factor-like uncharacterized protein